VPFNILDYGKTAGQVGDMAKDLNTLITSINQSTPEMQRLSQQASANMTEVVNHGFRLGLVLIGVLLVGAVVAGLLYRFLGEKLRPRGGGPPLPKR
jgi:F0F1-type ATP synthase assembly protein I